MADSLVSVQETEVWVVLYAGSSHPTHVGVAINSFWLSVMFYCQGLLTIHPQHTFTI